MYPDRSGRWVLRDTRPATVRRGLGLWGRSGSRGQRSHLCGVARSFLRTIRLWWLAARALRSQARQASRASTMHRHRRRRRRRRRPPRHRDTDLDGNPIGPFILERGRRPRGRGRLTPLLITGSNGCVDSRRRTPHPACRVSVGGHHADQTSTAGCGRRRVVVDDPTNGEPRWRAVEDDLTGGSGNDVDRRRRRGSITRGRRRRRHLDRRDGVR